MQRVLWVVLLASSLLSLSCGTSQEVISFWKNPKAAPRDPYTSVFIIAVAADKGTRYIVESDLATIAEANGLKAVRSIDVWQDTTKPGGLPAKEEMRGKILESKCEAVFTVSMLDAKSVQRYVPGTATYSGAYGYSPIASYSYYGNYSTYVAYSYPMTSSPGYYASDKTFFLEGNLYDAESGDIRWSMQSAVYNPANMKKTSKEYSELLIDELKKERRGIK
jgi:hypothetical protein